MCCRPPTPGTHRLTGSGFALACGSRVARVALGRVDALAIGPLIPFSTDKAQAMRSLHSPNLRDATRYLSSVGLRLERLVGSTARYRLSRIDGAGRVEHGLRLGEIWNIWEMDANGLLIDAAIYTRVKELPIGDPGLDAAIQWVHEGGAVPPVLWRTSARRAGTRRMPPGWKETVRPWMAIPPDNHLSLTPSLAALLRNGLQNDLKGRKLCLNIGQSHTEAAIDGSRTDQRTGHEAP